MTLVELDRVLRMPYIPIPSPNSKQEHVCFSLRVLHHHQDQYYSICKSNALLKSSTDLMEVATFKERKHCLG